MAGGELRLGIVARYMCTASKMQTVTAKLFFFFNQECFCSQLGGTSADHSHIAIISGHDILLVSRTVGVAEFQDE